MTQLLKVRGFNRAICYTCKVNCSRTYDTMNTCYGVIMKDLENPILKESVEKVLKYIDECEGDR
jgi:hypothetical protein